MWTERLPLFYLTRLSFVGEQTSFIILDLDGERDAEEAAVCHHVAHMTNTFNISLFSAKKTPHQIWESSELLALWSPPHYPLVSLYFLWHYLFSSLVAAAGFHFAFPLVVHFNNRQWAPESQFKSEIFWTVIFRTLCDKTRWNWDQIKTLQSLILLFISIWVCVWGKWHVYQSCTILFEHREKQLSQLSGVISATRRMMLTQLVFCVDSVTMRGNTTNLIDHSRRYHTARYDKTGKISAG